MNGRAGLDTRCMCCGSTGVELFYEVQSAPVNSVLLLSSQAEALNFRTGTIALGYCRTCGFISNLAFDAGLLEYSERYESTQSYSPTFNQFAHALAEDLVQRHDLRGKEIIEIGCGQGEFLTALCELGDNVGIGFDPAYVAGPDERGACTKAIQFIPDYYSDRYADRHADFICCKMTLEHVYDVAAFVRSVRKAIGDRLNTTVFFQVPNAQRILDKAAVWDIYYEHCSYFTPDALAYLFRHNGFEVLNVWTEYDEQYVLLEARAAACDESTGVWPDGVEAQPGRRKEEGEAGVQEPAVRKFAPVADAEMRAWHERLDAWTHAGKRGVIWGGGSKAVAFLTALGRSAPIAAAVDINPKKHGTFLPVSGLEIVAPETLRDYRPDFIIVMNPVYTDEICRTIQEMGVQAQVLPLG